LSPPRSIKKKTLVLEDNTEAFSNVDTRFEVAPSKLPDKL
jgi:hypothetical protein